MIYAYNKRTLTISCAALFLLGVCWRVPSIAHTVEQAASLLFYPFLCLQHRIADPCKQYMQQRRSATQLQAAYCQLQTAHEQLLSDYIALQATVDFHNDTQELVAFKKKYACDDACLAQVLQRTTSHDAHYVLLDKGSRHGIQEQMIVVHNNMLVGKISRLFPYHSECVLITDPRCKVAAYCARSGANGVTQGRPDGQLTMLHVHHMADIALGDLVMSSGEGLLFPRGFGIGKIANIEKNELTYTIGCEPLIDVGRLKYCYIMLRSL